MSMVNKTHNRMMYALLVGYVAIGIYPPEVVIKYVMTHGHDESINKYSMAFGVVKGAPDMLNNVVRDMMLEFLKDTK